MAKKSSAAAVLVNLVLILSAFFLFVSMAEGGRTLFTGLFGQATPKCDEVYGAKTGDTCFGVTQQFNLTTELFGSINPNLQCDRLFVGQWLCIAGTAN